MRSLTSHKFQCFLQCPHRRTHRPRVTPGLCPTFATLMGGGGLNPRWPGAMRPELFCSVVVSVVSMVPGRSPPRYQWYLRDDPWSIIDTEEIISVVSLILRKFIVYRISLRIRRQIRNDFYRLIRGLVGLDLWKNRGSKISWYTVPLNAPFSKSLCLKNFRNFVKLKISHFYVFQKLKVK
jgi:hypothetical protein